MSLKNPILIIGMARSGTTLVSHILGSLPNVHVEVEPHALWKSGNFRYLSDEEYDITKTITNNIKNKFIKESGDKVIIEKSPINSLRPNLVHAVFPEAKIVYVERDPIRCIYSNYNRSLKRDSFKLSITLKKYFFYTGSKDLDGAISDRTLLNQISLSDAPQLIKYSLKMFYLRQFKTLPFGPKLKDFINIVNEKGLLGYHVEVYKRSMKYKKKFIELYGDNLEVFKMENIMSDPEEVKRLVEFTGLPYTEKWLSEIRGSFDKERVTKSIQKRDIDRKIEELILAS